MNFRDYVSEGINKPWIDLKVVQKEVNKYKKFKGKSVKTKDIIKMISKIGTMFSESVNLEFNLETQKVNDLPGEFVISGAFDEDTLNIYFNYTDDEILITDLLWGYLLNDFPGFIKHEVLHYQQMLRREDKDTYRELEGGRVNPKKYVDGNLGHKDEIEAYAMNASSELFNIYGLLSKDKIKNNLLDTIKASDSMSDYYKLIRKDKKLWNKFIKKVLLYLKLEE